MARLPSCMGSLASRSRSLRPFPVPPVAPSLPIMTQSTGRPAVLLPPAEAAPPLRRKAEGMVWPPETGGVHACGASWSIPGGGASEPARLRIDCVLGSTEAASFLCAAPLPHACAPPWSVDPCFPLPLPSPSVPSRRLAPAGGAPFKRHMPPSPPPTRTRPSVRTRSSQGRIRRPSCPLALLLYYA